MSFPKTPKGQYSELNRKYFGGTLPKDVDIRLVEDMSEGNFIDTRCDMAAVEQGEDGTWRMEVNAGLPSFPKLMFLVIAHECVHIKLPEAAHGSKEWRREVRRLQGMGLLLRVF